MSRNLTSIVLAWITLGCGILVGADATNALDEELHRIDVEGPAYFYPAGAERITAAGSMLIPNYDKALYSTVSAHSALIGNVLYQNEIFSEAGEAYSLDLLTYAEVQLRKLPKGPVASYILSYLAATPQNSPRGKKFGLDHSLAPYVAAYLWEEPVVSRITTAQLEKSGQPGHPIKLGNWATQVLHQMYPTAGIIHEADLESGYDEVCVARAKTWVMANLKDEVGPLRKRLEVER